MRCSAQAGMPPAIEISQIASPGESGFTTYFFDVIPVAETSITSVEGRFSTDVPRSMRQVNPFNLSTVLNDNNATFMIVGENPLADSQFEFNSGEAQFVINTSESDTELTAALAGVGPLGTKFTLAHIVVADDVLGVWRIDVVQRQQGGVSREYSQSGFFGPNFGRIPGDYNVSGAVDAADYIVWRDTLTQTGAGLAADGNGNQTVDVGDYDVWRANFGRSAASVIMRVGSAVEQSNSVPEPASWFMLAAAVALPRRVSRVSNRRAIRRAGEQ